MGPAASGGGASDVGGRNVVGTRRWASALGWTVVWVSGAYAQQGELLHVLQGGGAAGRGLGHAVAPAGDVDGDGHGDLIVGFRTGVGGGTVQVFSGASGAVLFTFVGEMSGDLFGRAVAGAGDVDGDGVPDLIVGAAGVDAHGIDSGSAYVFSGRDGGLIHEFRGDFARMRLGGAVSGAGDVDRDGFADLIVGGQPDSNTPQPRGFARVYSGRDGSVLYEFIGGASTSRLGCAVDGVGDVNGDGVPDLLVGDWRDGTSAAGAGSVSVFSGADGSLLLRVYGERANDRLGTVVGRVGDIDGDGRADLLAATPWADAASLDVGLVRVYSGADGRVLHSIHGSATLDFFGGAAAGIGDFDADGVPDFAVGAYGDDDGGSGSGSVTVYSGADGSVLLRIDGDSAADELGYSVCGAGNASGRRSADLAIGAPNDNQGAGPASGAVFVLAGATPAPDPDPEPEPDPDPIPSVVRHCEPGPNAFGTGARLDCLCEGEVRIAGFALHVDGARPRSAGFFFFGAGRQSQPFMKGTLCVAPVRFRLGAAVHLDRKGSARLVLETVRPRRVIELLAPGTTWNFQFVYLDPPACGSGPFNLSDALSVTFAP